MEDKCANKSFKCDECAHHAQEYHEYPCTECDHNGGEYKMFFPAVEMNKILGQSEPSRIKDSGERRVFETGAVRDIQEGVKGRCDLLPLDVVGEMMMSGIFTHIDKFQQDGKERHLIETLVVFAHSRFGDLETMFLETAKHFEAGAKKYAENNWRKGIPVKSYIDSAVRHYLKFLRGDDDEPHDLALCWNLMCAVWTCRHKPELNDYAKKDGE